MVGRCIAYWNCPFFGGHVTFPGCNHKETMSIFGDTQLLMSEISQSWPGHLFEHWKSTLQTPTKHRLNRWISLWVCCERPIRTWGPRDFNLIGNPELANCNELLRVKGEGLWPGFSGYRNVQQSHFNLCIAGPHHCTPSLYPIQTLYWHYLLLWLLQDAFVLKLPQVPMGGWCSIACDWRAWVHLWFTELLHHPPLGCMSWMWRWWTTPPEV